MPAVGAARHDQIARMAGRGVGFGKKYPEFWIKSAPRWTASRADSGVHICLRAPDTAAVDAFHAAALKPAATPTARRDCARNITAAIMPLSSATRRQPHRGGDVLKATGPGMTGYITAGRPAPPSPCPLRRLARGFAQHGQNFFDVLGDEEIDAQRRWHEFHGAHVLDQGQERSPIAGDIGDQDRLLVAAELSPGDLLDQFFERAKPARQGDEGVGASNIVRLRSCISRVTISSCASRRGRSRLVRNSGMMPVTSPPCSSTDSASAPIRPTEPPP